MLSSFFVRLESLASSMRRARVLCDQSAPTLGPNFLGKETHSVTNQPPPFVGYNAFLRNKRLRDSVSHFSRVISTVYYPGSKSDDYTTATMEALTHYGGEVGDGEHLRWAHVANTNIPTFKPYDHYGHRVNGVVFNDHYHNVMKLSFKNAVPTYPWGPAKLETNVRHSNDMDMISAGASAAYSRGFSMQGFVDPTSQIRRAASSYMHYQLEGGTGCPQTMTFACFPVLAVDNNRRIREESSTEGGGPWSLWLQKLSAADYDGADAHISLKTSATLGMSMTEKQGGSDVRANTTVATPVITSSSSETELPEYLGPDSKAYTIVGHKWFTSAPMCDGFLVLANTDNNLSCFLVPRWLAPGVRNTGLRFQQLKSKLGDRSNASSEVEYHNAIGYLVGKPGHGIKTIMTMVGLTRLDCMLGSAGLMNISLLNAIHHTDHRSAFGKTLAEQPLMMNVLTDLALEAEAATALALRVTAAISLGMNGPHLSDPSAGATLAKQNDLFSRIACAIGKYHICKLCPNFVYESLECLGGNGYTEEGFVMSRHYRQAPLNAVWEGSGNVIVLDVFRAMSKDPMTVKALQQEVAEVKIQVGGNAQGKVLVGIIEEELQAVLGAIKELGKEAAVSGSDDLMILHGRTIVERLACVLQGAALLRTEDSEEFLVSSLFIKSRVARGGANHGRHYGTLTSSGCGYNERAARTVLARFRQE